MKVIVVTGSPRKESISTRIARRIAQGAQENGHEIVYYDINNLNVRGCQSCYVCKNTGSDCVLKDDLLPYWKDLHECGALIVAAPNYASNVCGPMLTYMNRHYCLLDKQWNTKLEPGKIKLIGVFAQGRADSYDVAEKNYDWYLGDFLNRKMVLVEKIVATSTTDMTEDGAMLQHAYELGKAL